MTNVRPPEFSFRVKVVNSASGVETCVPIGNASKEAISSQSYRSGKRSNVAIGIAFSRGMKK